MRIPLDCGDSSPLSLSYLRSLDQEGKKSGNKFPHSKGADCEPCSALKCMFAVEAEITADRLVDADVRGIHSHGSRALPRYIKAMDEGNIDPRASITTVCDTVGTLCSSRSAIRARSGTAPSSSSSKMVRRYISIVSMRSCSWFTPPIVSHFAHRCVNRRLA